MSEQLEEILAECFLRIESEGSSVLDEICDLHPDLAGAIREQVSSAQGLGLVAAGDAPEFPERLGEFRLVERIGGGGMGVVFRAEQESLGRQVAVKVVRPEHLYFPKTRERFQREAQAVARLNHPGIVPVHAVGTDAGVPWFAMELVEGVSLAEIVASLHGRDPAKLEGRHLVDVLAASPRVSLERAAIEGAAGGLLEGPWIDVVLRLARQAAEALEHAHSHGVLHRDIKPSNLMVTPAGRVLLLDFGLAHDEEASPMTRTGQLLGSLPYMSPEQIEGGDVDARTDVYSLGVTLCELLTLSPPFDAVSTEETRRRILDGRLPPPRATNRAVGWDVETICLVATATDRRSRFASAADLAREIDRVLRGETITARRVSRARRASHWVRRHPAAAVASILAFVLIVGGPILFSLQQKKAVDELTVERNLARAAELRAHEQKKIALDARDDAREKARIAEEQTAIAAEHWRFFNAIILNAATLTNGGHEYTLGDILHVLDERADEVFADSPVVACEIYSGLATAWLDCGDRRRSLAAAENAVRWAEKCDGVNDEMLPQALNALVLSLVGNGRARDAVAVGRRSVKAHETVLGGTAILANAMGNLALALGHSGKVEEAIEVTTDAIAIYEAQEEEDPRVIFDLRYRLGGLYREAGRFDDSERILTAQAAFARGAFGEDTAEYARTISSLALTYLDWGRPEEGLPVSRRVVATYLKIAGPEHPHSALVLRNHGVMLAKAGRRDEAEDVLLDAIEIYEKLPGERRELAKTRGCLGNLLRDFEEWEDAADAYGDAAAAERSAGRAAGDAGFHLASRGECLVRVGRVDEALEAFDEGVRLMESSGRHVAAGWIHDRAAKALRDRGDARRAAARFLLAAAQYARGGDRDRTAHAYHAACRLQDLDDSIVTLEKSLAVSRGAEPLHGRRAFAAIALAERLVKKEGRRDEVLGLVRESVAAYVAAGDSESARKAVGIVVRAARREHLEDLATQCEAVEIPGRSD